METVLGRYRNLIILVGVLFLQALGLAVQVKRGNDAENTRLIRIWAVDAITPLERCLIWAQNGTGSLWHNYFYLRGVRAENRQLKDQIEQMRLEQVRLKEDAAQARRLQSLLSFKEQFISRTVAAQVIGSSGSDLSRSVYIDKGSDQGVQIDMAVITADGIVGKVLRVFPSTSLVLLINDQSSGVGAVLEKTRLQGVLRGTPNGEVMLERVMSDEQVPEGETVLTSGGDQIFPKGLPVGKVANVGGKEKETFLNIKIKPAANLSKLEEVLVVMEKQERQPVAQDTARVRAADILAQRLPSVPETPAAGGGGSVPAVSAASGASGASGASPGSANSGSTNSGAANAGTKLQPQAGAGLKPQTVPLAQPTTAANPPKANASSSPTGTKPAGVAPSGQAVKNATGTSVGSAEPAKVLPGTSKPVVPKTVPKTKPKTDPANGTAAGVATEPATTGSKPDESKPSETSPPKAAPQASPQPPAPEDSPN
jgi:rod shape-determining protein MreC